MRILHIDLGREFRGGQHQVLLLLGALRQVGHDSTLLVRADSPIADPAFELGFSVKLASPHSLRILSPEYDIVHAHDASSHTWAAIVCRKPFVVSRRVAFAVSRLPLSTLKYRRARRYLAVSKFVAARLMNAGVPESKIDVVYDAVPPAASMQPWNPDAPLVALGTSDKKKGRDLVELAAGIARHPVTFSRDLPHDLANASAFVYISRSEGFGSAALLAMTMGVPVIASRIDGMVEVFEDGVSGLSVDNDPPAIASAIQRVRENPAATHLLIEQARRRADTLFNPEVLVSSTVASYRRALGAV